MKFKNEEIDTGPLKWLALQFALHEGIAKAHQRKREDLLRQASFEEAGAQDDYDRAVKALADGLAENKVNGGVAAVLNVSYDLLVLALPGDYIYVHEKQGDGWKETIYGPPLADEDSVTAHLHPTPKEEKDKTFDELSLSEQDQVKAWLKANKDTREGSDGRTMRWPRVNVAPIDDNPPKEPT